MLNVNDNISGQVTSRHVTGNNTYTGEVRLYNITSCLGPLFIRPHM